MLLDVVIGACAALAAAGVLLAVSKLFRIRISRSIIMGVAAIAIFGVTAALRYQWADRTAALLPPEMVVVERLTFSNPIEPWSLVQPVTDRLVVVDTGSVLRSAAHPGMVLVDVLLVRRDGETLVARHLVDCTGRRDAVVPPDADLSGGDLPQGLTWADDAPAGLYTAACKTA